MKQRVHARLRWLQQERGRYFRARQMMRDWGQIVRVSRGPDSLRLLHYITSMYVSPSSRPLHASDMIRFRVRKRGQPFDVHIRRNSSDLYTFAEVFLRHVYDAVVEHLPARSAALVDLGAHIGLVSLLLSALGHFAEVICVEPVADNLRVLRWNMQANGQAWRIVNKAVGDTRGRHRFYGSEWWSSGTIMPGVGETRQANSSRPESFLALPPFDVDVITIPDLIAEHDINRIGMLKIDIEGAEELIITPGASWLSIVDLLVIDIHSKYIDDRRVFEALASHSFREVARIHAHSYLFKREP